MTANDTRPGVSSRNLILRRLSQATLAAIGSDLATVALARSQVLYGNDSPIEAVYFMESGLVDFIADTGDKAEVQVGMVGREGFAGSVSVFDDDLTSIHRAVVRVAGSALRMEQSRFQEAVQSLPELRLLCLKHTKVSMLQVSQIAACNARHSILQRLCRLILMIQDRVGGTRLTLTQEDFAFMLGVRRAGISVTITELEASRAVRQSRGCLDITDGAALMGKACSCHGLFQYRQSLIMDSA